MKRLLAPVFRLCTCRKRGVTIIELLVTLAVIALLLSLTLPAIQSGRETARRSQCLYNLRQLAIASHSFHERQNSLPWQLKVRVQSPSFPPILSVWAHLLPDIGQIDIYRSIDFSEDARGIEEQPPFSQQNSRLLTQSVAVFKCPSDGVAKGGTSYRACMGTASVPAAWSDRRSGLVGAFASRSAQGVRFAEFGDGLSQTILCSEKIAGDRNTSKYSPVHDTAFVPASAPLYFPDQCVAACSAIGRTPSGHASFGGITWLFAGYGFTWYNHVLTPNSRIPDCSDASPLIPSGATTARSWHHAGVNVALADGACRFVNEQIDQSVWHALGSRSGSETVSDY